MLRYTIFDGDPAQSGPCSWPDRERYPIRERDPKEAARKALKRACREARASGEYGEDDRLWVIIWDGGENAWKASQPIF